MPTWAAILLIGLTLLAAIQVVLSAVIFRQLGVFILGSAQGANDSGIPVGRRLPDVQLTALDGSELRTAVGDRRLLFFGATYCDDCERVMPALLPILQYASVHLSFMLFERTPGEAQEMAIRLGLPLDRVVAIDQQVGHKFDVAVIPYAYAVDEDGVIRDRGLTIARPHLQRIVESVGCTLDERLVVGTGHSRNSEAAR